MIIGSVQPLLPASENPYSIEPKPMVEVVMERMSNFWLLVGKTLFIKKKASTKTNTQIGMIIPKSSRHDQLSTIQPERVGPKAGANPITIPTDPMAAPRFSGGKMDNMIVWSKGIVTPTPRAWMSRPVSNEPKSGAMKDKIVPIKKVVMAVRYIMREPNLLINHAETGIMIPLTRKNPVESHSTVAVLTSKDFIIEGKAVASKVPFKTVQKEPTISTMISIDRL